MKCYVINLDRDARRLEHVREQFGQAGLDFERVVATDGRLIDEAPDRVLLPPTLRLREWSPAELGCTISHFRTWKMIAEGEERYGAVFEDDVFLDPSIAEAFARLEKVGNRFDVVKFDSNLHWVARDRWPLATLGEVTALYRLRSTHHGGAAYVLSRKTAAGLVARIGELDLPIDDVLFGPHPMSRGLNVVQAVPALAQQSVIMAGAERRPHLASRLGGEREEKATTKVAVVSLARRVGWRVLGYTIHHAGVVPVTRFLSGRSVVDGL